MSLALRLQYKSAHDQEAARAANLAAASSHAAPSTGPETSEAAAVMAEYVRLQKRQLECEAKKDTLSFNLPVCFATHCAAAHAIHDSRRSAYATAVLSFSPTRASPRRRPW